MLSRAIAGVEKPVWKNGTKVGSVTEYSDTMGMALLKRHGDAGESAKDRTAEMRAATARRHEDEQTARAAFVAMLEEIHDRLIAEDASGQHSNVSANTDGDACK